MKIELNHRQPRLSVGALSYLLLVGLLVPVFSASAQIAGTAPAAAPTTASASNPTPMSAPATMAPAVQASPDASAAPSVVPPPTDPSLTASIPVVTDKGDNKGLSGSEDKVSDSVKALAHRLSSTDNVTLEDLNSARQAVAKIEALIDIEKHLSELDKLRSEREGSRFTMPTPMPASAFGTLPLPTPMPANMQGSHAMIIPSTNNIDLLRIMGSDGHFSALVKTGEGQSRLVDVGDKVDGATVTSISASGIELDREGSKHIVHMKKMQTVSNNANSMTP